MAAAAARRKTEAPQAPAPKAAPKRPPPKIAGTPQVDKTETQQEKLTRAYEVIIGELASEFERRVAARADLESRWETDLRQYHGRYESDVEARLKKQKRSRVFVNITRKRTHGWEARLSDMLFPTDDKNWGIQPTPLPTHAKKASDALRKAQMFADRANRMRTMKNQAGEAKALDQGAVHSKAHKESMAALDDAKKRADAMEKLIDDQFVESNYGIKVRQAIHDACKVGTGVIKGPLISSKVKRQFVKDPANPKLWRMAVATEKTVEWKRVDYFNFFPDMTVPTVDEGDGTFERYMPNAKELKALTAAKGFDKAQVAQLLRDGPQGDTPLYISKLREINNAGTYDLNKCFTVVEWHGVLNKDQLEAMAAVLGTDTASGMIEDLDLDELDELPVIIWFCQGKVLKYGPHPLDSGSSLYSAFQFEKDETCPFGYGVPYLMRDSQAALNGAWRMVMDNGSVSTGPQVVIDPEQVEPEDGVRRIVGNKLWIRKGEKKNTPAFEFFQVQDNQAQLFKIVEMARDFADEESVMPLIAQGDQGTHTTQTKGGMAILMNASNVVFRRVVKNFDDYMTVPNLTRSYEYNMLHSNDDSVKGDHQVDARGSSVLLVKEMQAQNLMAMALQFTNHPVLGPLTKAPQLYRRLVQAHNLPADDIVKTDDEIAQEQAEQAQHQQQDDPEMQKLQTQLQIAKMRGDFAVQVARENRITEMMKVAQLHNMKLDEIQAMFAVARMEDETEQRIFAADVAVTDRRDRLAASLETKGARSSPLPSSTGTPRASAPKGGKPQVRKAPAMGVGAGA
jgi:hypothetical protein